MGPISFHEDDAFGIGVGSIPYVAVRLTTDQAKTIRAKLAQGKTPRLYKTDGREMFAIRNQDGSLSGDYMIYILFD